MNFRKSLGLTLVEVVVAIALAGTLLATALMASTSHLRQLKQAKQRREATVVLDQFLSEWSMYRYADRELMEIASDHGLALMDKPALPDQLVLYTEVMMREPLPQAEVVRVELRDDDGATTLCWVEVVREGTGMR